ncbi:MAG: DUF4340 domain-containing protein [Thermodesulfobacteriota bacterium]
MKIKTEYLVLALVIAGLSLFLYFRNADRVLYDLPDTGSLKKEQVARVEIQVPQKALVVLEKKDDAWRLASGAPAKPVDAGEIVETVTGLTLTALVSEREDLARYDLSPDKAMTVTAFAPDGKVLRALAVGKTAPTASQTFVRIDGDPRVYHARGRLSHIFDKTSEELTDRRVMVFDRGNVTRLAIEQATARLALEKSEAAQDNAAPGAAAPAQWTMPDGKVADADAVDRLLDALLRLECAAYRDPAGSNDPGEPLCIITVTDTKDHALSIFSPEGEETPDYPGRSSRSDLAFRLATDRTAELLKSASDLISGVNTSDPEE